MRRAQPVQTTMAVEEPSAAAKKRDDEIAEQRAIFAAFVAACRVCVRDAGGYDPVTAQLEAIWGELGRHVSAGVLKSTLSEGEQNRNYFRFEWAIWFARQSEDCAALLGKIIDKPAKTPEEELRDLKALMRRKLGTVAEELIRKAESPL